MRDTARKFIEDNLVPIIEECNRAGRFPRELVKPMADLGFFGASLQGLWLRRHVERRIRTGHAGTGARRFRRALVRQRAVGAGDVSDLYLRLRRAEKYLAARAAEGRKARLLRIDRARLRLEPRRHAHTREKSRQRICAERREDVDHIGHDRRRRGHLGQGRKRGRQGPRLSGRNRPARLQGRRHPRQVVVARVGDLGACHCRMCTFRSRTCCRGRAD